MSQFTQMIKEKYPGKAILNKKEVCEILRIGEGTLNRYLSANQLDCIPKFKRFGKGPKARYIFPVDSVVEFLEA